MRGKSKGIGKLTILVLIGLLIVSQTLGVFPLGQEVAKANPEDAVPIEFGETLSGSIDAAGEMDAYVFSANASDVVLVRVSAWQPMGIILYCPNGTKLKGATGSIIVWLSSLLPDDGEHKILFYALLSMTGSYNIYLQRLNNPANAIPIEFGETLSGSIDAAAEMDTYIFSANASDVVLVRVSAWPRPMGIILYCPNGTKLKGASGSPAELSSLLPIDGEYKILVYDLLSITGSYKLSLKSMMPEQLVLDEPFADSISSGEWRYYKVDTEAGKNLLVRLKPSSSAGSLELYGRYGESPTRSKYDCIAKKRNVLGNYELLISPTEEGTYYFSVYGRDVEDTLSYEITACIVDRHVSDIYPRSLTNSTKVIVHITGIGFTNGMRVELRNASALNIPAQTVIFSSPRMLVAHFNLSDAPLGLYDVSVIWPDDYEKTIEGAVEVNELQEGALYSFLFEISKGSTLKYDIEVPQAENLFVTLQKTTLVSYGNSWSGKLSLLHGEEEIASDSGSHDLILHIVGPEPGLYTINVAAHKAGKGILTVWTSLPELPLGEWVVGTIYCSYGSVWYQVEVPPDQDVLCFEAEAMGLWSHFDIYYSEYGSSQHWVSPQGTRTSLEIPNPDPGVYIVQFLDSAMLWSEGRWSSDQSRDVLIKAEIKEGYDGVHFPLGDKSFADEVVDFGPGSGTGEIDGSATIGPPDASENTGPSVVGNKGDVSLGNGGSITIKFIDNCLTDVDGPDLYVFEYGPSIEPFKVEISEDGSNWIDLGTIKGQPASLDIHGKVAPGDEFRYVRITDANSHMGGSSYAGADIDAVGAIGVREIIPPPGYQPFITKLSPDRGGNTGLVTVEINGGWLDLNATVSLVHPDYADITAHIVYGSSDGTALTATFNLTDKELGEWNLVVTNPDSQSVAAPTPFIIEEGREPELRVDIIGREKIRIGREQKYIVRYGNLGNTDAEFVLVVIKLPPEVECIEVKSGQTTIWDQTTNADESLFFMFPENSPGKVYSLEVTLKSSGSTIIAGVKEWLRAKRFRKKPIEFISFPWEKGTKGGLIFDGKAHPARSGHPKKFPSDQGERDKGPIPQGRWEIDKLEYVPKLHGWAFHLHRIDPFPYDRDVKSFWIHTGNWTLGTKGCIKLKQEDLNELIDFYHRQKVFYPNEKIEVNVNYSLNLTTGSQKLELVKSTTPEDKYGPSGFDVPDTPYEERERFVPADQNFYYKVDFWNKENATAPACDVFVKDQLDTDLDWSTFRFEEIGFLKWTVDLEPCQYFSVNVDMRPEMDLIVNVEGTFDPETGEIDWVFKSLDPGTMETPEDPMAGFLPPITESGYEIGWVCFSVDPKTGLPTETQITNQAFVKFDVGDFHPAPKEGPFVNTIDAAPPTSSVTATLNGETIQLNWTGNDLNGSGIRDYTIYVSEDENTYEPWLLHTTNSSVALIGESGHTYAFYSIARDNVGNIEEAPTEPDVTITIDTTPPTISVISPENKTYTVNDVPLTFTVSESISWVGYSLDGQMNATISGNTTIVGLSDGTHTIKVYANDTAGNTGASEIIYFSIETQAEPPQMWIIGLAVAAIAVATATITVFWRKRKQPPVKA